MDGQVKPLILTTDEYRNLTSVFGLRYRDPLAPCPIRNLLKNGPPPEVYEEYTAEPPDPD